MRRFFAAALAVAALLLMQPASPPATAQGLTEAQCAVDSACLAQFDVLARAAETAFARAVVHAVVAAQTVTASSGGSTSYCDTFAGACSGGANGYRNAPGAHGALNAITDVPGLLLGHYTNPAGPTGTTALYFPDGAIAGVEVRGSAPGSRESDALKVPTPQRVNAVLLGGGSAFGLAAGDGIVQWLREQGKGYAVPGGSATVPIVPGAIIFDLYRFGHSDLIYPDASYGYRAAQAANSGPVGQGNVGAGAGAETGSVKGGFGTASVDLGNGVIVGAVVSVNSVGDTYDPGNGCGFYAGNLQLQQEFGALRPPPGGCGSSTPVVAPAAAGVNHAPPKNTTIGVVATNVPLDKGLAARLAQAGQDGLALAIRPAHTMLDGDTMFAVSTAKLPAGATVPTPSPSSASSAADVSVSALPFSAGPAHPAPWAGAALVTGAAGLLMLPLVRRRIRR